MGSKRWGSVTFAEMERLERLFRCQLEATSSSLWMMSGIFAMLKRDGFNPSTPGLFNTAISSVSASLAFQVRTAASGSVFLRSKRRESLLAHSKVPIPELRKARAYCNPWLRLRSVQMSLSSTWWRCRLRRIPWFPPPWLFLRLYPLRFGSKPLASSSSPLAGPSGYRPPRPAQRSEKHSASSSHSGGRNRFKGGKGLAPSSKPSGFRK